ncbi:hypothetical protein RIR_jg26221.t1 [Rhizophagus irregularis DAOM 181602=DAOM 197198]|nr:hypothetical protein RIR_jg26221.t1 [Rhizophagus irregularis DAOM 181602=DAOM 197198]
MQDEQNQQISQGLTQLSLKKKHVSLFQRCEKVEEKADVKEGGMTTAGSLVAIHIEESSRSGMGDGFVSRICDKSSSCMRAIIMFKNIVESIRLALKEEEGGGGGVWISFLS